MPLKTKDSDLLKVLSETGQSLVEDLDKMMNGLHQEGDEQYTTTTDYTGSLDKEEEERLTQAFNDYILNALEEEAEGIHYELDPSNKK